MSVPPTTRAKSTRSREKQPPQRWNRPLYLLSVISFFFPFATVKGCEGAEDRTYTGFELIGEETGGLLLGVPLLAVFLFAFSFRRRILTTTRRVLAQSLKALLCALAIGTAGLATEMAFLFEPVREEVGFYLCLGSWLILYLLSMRSALRNLVLAQRRCPERPPPWGLAFVLLLTASYSLTSWLSAASGYGDLILGLLLTILFGAPLVVMATLAAVRYRLRRPKTQAT